MGDETGEAGQRRQQRAATLVQRSWGRVAGDQAEADEQDGDHPDQQADGAFVEEAEGQRTDGNAQRRAGQHDPEVGRVPLAPIGLEADHVGQAEDRQHDGHGLLRRRRQGQQRHGKTAQGTAETALGQPGEEDRRQGEQQEIVQGHGGPRAGDEGAG